MSEPSTGSFLAACRGEPVPHTPVWFMRQAGRSLPEYRAVRSGLPMLEACRRHGVDAAILFSDIVVPLAAAGVDVDIKPGVGPVVAEPVRDAAAVAKLPHLYGDEVSFVAEAGL